MEQDSKIPVCSRAQQDEDARMREVLGSRNLRFKANRSPIRILQKGLFH